MNNPLDLSDARHALLELRRVGQIFCQQLSRWTQPRSDGHADSLQAYLAECDAQLRALGGGVPGIDDRDPALSPDEQTFALQRMLTGVRASPWARTRILQLRKALHLTDLELDVLLLSALSEESSLFGTLFSFLTGQSAIRRPTVQLALNFCAAPDQREELLAALCAGPLIRTGMLSLDADDAPLSDRMLHLAPEVWPALCGVDAIEPLLHAQRRAAPPGANPPVLPPEQTEQVHRLAQLLVAGQVRRIVISGPVGSGRRTLARFLARHADRTLVEFSLPAADVTGRFVPAVIRHALLRDAGLLLVVEPGATETLAITAQVPEDMCCILCLPPKTDVVGSTFADAVHVPLVLPRARERARLWTQAWGDVRAPEPMTLARRYAVSGGEIMAVATVAQARALLQRRDTVTEEDVREALRQRPAMQIEALAQRRRPAAMWDDLVLPEACLAQLEELSSRVLFRDQVFHEWGMAPGSRQTGTVALFTGPSGTGKTLAAEVLAGRLGLELYSIDLSRVVSKYIGETERNLARVFDAIEGTASVLFFDEADALFGRRTETRDAHDRYANLEVSYLLTRLESFAGLAILASNIRQNIDQAFLRRFDFIVEFSAPDEAARRKLWQRHLRGSAPMDPCVDLTRLAELFAVSGGHIRNAAIAAAFLAARSGTSITMEHLFSAMRREYEKLGKAFPAH